MRCPDCSKMVAFDTDTEVEIRDEEFNEKAETVSYEARIVNNCAECGTELKEANFSVEIVDVKIEHKSDCNETDRTYTVEVESGRSDRSEGKGRGTKTFYGFSATACVTCDGCGESVSVDYHDDIQASQMEELV